MSLFSELRRRNVFGMLVLYVVGAWAALQIADLAFPAWNIPDSSIRYVWIAAVLGLPVALIFSWRFDVTVKGIKRTPSVHEGTAGLALKTADHVLLVGLSTVAIAMLAVLTQEIIVTRGDGLVAPLIVSVFEPPEKSIGVLPFENMSDDPEQEYFSNGLTETLLNMLAQIPDLKVAARTSSFAFKDQDKTIQEISRVLGVAYVLEGSVQRVGERVRITAQLIRAADGFHVWSENYDRTFDDIFGIQDEIAEKVGGALSVSLLGTAPGMIGGVKTQSTDAYDLYLRALNEQSTLSFAGLREAEDLLKAALTIDPDFVEAKVELADNYLQQVFTGLMTRAEARPQALAIADQALALDPNHGSARAIQIFAETIGNSAPASSDALYAAVAELEEIVAREPNLLRPKILLNYFYSRTHQREKALPVMLDARERDPLNPRIHFSLGRIYSDIEQWDNARAAFTKSLEFDPNQPNAYVYMAITSAQTGDGLEYLQLFLKAMEVDPVDYELPGFIAAFLYSLELVEEGDEFKNRVMAVAPTSSMAYGIVLLRAIAIGDEKAGVAAARRAIEDDVYERYGGFSEAVRYLLRVAAVRGTLAEESAYLEEHAPGILDVDAASLPVKYRVAQRNALYVWYTVLPEDELYRRLDLLWQIADDLGIDRIRNTDVELLRLVLRGEVETATEIALNEIFTEPVTVNLGWEQRFTQAPYAEIIEDPRVQAAMKKWQEEEDALREQIRYYLADRNVGI